MPAEFESGFFVRSPAWHGQGNVLSEAPDTSVAFEQSGMDWKVLKMPLFFKMPDERRMHQAEEFALVRETDRSQLGCCKAEYEIFQNVQGFEWCRPLVESELWSWETAGSLREGKVCWALLKMDEIEVIPGDVLKRYLLVSWTHTGKMANIVMPTGIRVVCSNTWAAALKSGGGDRVIHTSNLVPKMNDIRKLYEVAVAQFTQQKEDIDKMLGIPMEDADLLLYSKALCMPVTALGNPDLEQQSEITLALLRTFVVDGRASGSKELGIKNTAYGAFTAYSEVNEHILGGAKIKDRGMSILFGAANDRNADALKLALEWPRVKEVKGEKKYKVIGDILG